MIVLGIVEDDNGIRESLVEYLKTEPEFETVFAERGVEEFLQNIHKHPTPDIVLLDINLGGMTGIEGIPFIKEALPNVEIMMISVLGDSNSIFKSICAGATGYIDKETPLNKIKEAIITLSEGGSPITPAIARKMVDFFSPKKTFSEDLTARERDIIQGIVDGLSYKMIADRLNISMDTVRKHILKTYRKLQINSKGELLAKFHQGKIM